MTPLAAWRIGTLVEAFLAGAVLALLRLALAVAAILLSALASLDAEFLGGEASMDDLKRRRGSVRVVHLALPVLDHALVVTAEGVYDLRDKLGLGERVAKIDNVEPKGLGFVNKLGD